MKIFFKLILINTALFLFPIYGQFKVKKALFVIVDEISGDVIEKIAKPNLDEISAVGGFTRVHVGGEKGTYSQTKPRKYPLGVITAC